MLSFFRKKPASCPVDEDIRLWMDKAFKWLWYTFGEDLIRSKQTLLPDDHHFPIVFDGNKDAANRALIIVATQMDFNPDDIILDYFAELNRNIGTGGLGGGELFIKYEKDSTPSSGLYHGKKEDDKYHISLEENNLLDPIGLVSTLAHEIAHIKLLGENRLKKNNESLTDLTTIVYGMGVISANAAFRFNSGFKEWGYQKLGYLSQIEWGYALAVYATMLNQPCPSWANHLTDTVKGNFKRGVEYILTNQ